MNYLRGSEWRKWDLHVHTRSSYDYSYNAEEAEQALVNSLREKDVSAIAITDHFVIDKSRIEKIKKLAPELTVFPGVELRFDKAAPNVHVILIFSEKSDLEKLANEFQVIMINDKAKSSKSNDTIYWDFKDIVEFARKRKAIISVHAGKKDKGVDDAITNSLEVNMAIKREIADEIDIFEMGQKKDIDDYKAKVFPTIGKKPMIICSDNHDPRNYFLKENLWIKADPNFDGLIQTILHPDERVYVGNTPLILERVKKNRAAYMSDVAIHPIENPKVSSENWFDCNLPINLGLTAVIGNKGSGKSALADIMGHLCRCSSTMEHASFLNDERFRNKPENRASDYVAELIWIDGEKCGPFSLSEKLEPGGIESAQFLPQKYIELVCNDLGNEFQKEINNVIFSYIDITEKGNTTSLDELIKKRSEGFILESKNIQNSLRDKSEKLCELENKLTSKYKKEYVEQLKKRKADFERHEKNKPKEVEKPSDEENETTKKISELNTLIEEINLTIDSKKLQLTQVNENINELDNTIKRIEVVVHNIDEVNVELSRISKNQSFDIDLKMEYATPLERMIKKKEEYVTEKKLLQSELEESKEKPIDNSLMIKREQLISERTQLTNTVSGKEKAYQQYLEEMEAWKIQQKEIIGDDNTENSIKHYEIEIKRINEDYPKRRQELSSDIKEHIKVLYGIKKKVAQIYKDLYGPIEKELELILGDIDDKIEFSVDISLIDADVGIDILNFFNKNMIGLFQGVENASITMKELIDQTQFDSIDSIMDLIGVIIEDVTTDMDAGIKKVKNKERLYNLLFCLDYIDAEYKLKLGGRTLQALSPGEKGIVLLVFYLALSKNDIPLIIDQPEDNLDNQSVYDKLVPCIKAAKNRRQVFIVTHNPNIAIACDAEQIITCHIDKKDNHIDYLSGSIENKKIRDAVIDILEGTMPAFDLRRLKYTSDHYILEER